MKFVSIADEKVARVFEASRNFVEMVNELSSADIKLEGVRFI
jgi:hypothetical protein